nr:DNA-directed RNA polymerase subunit alpha [Candidatus Woesebacteria bacterium]
MLNPTFYTKQTVTDEGLSTTFTFEPLSQSFGHTLGNAYRRTLLSSIPGVAITGVKFTGASHLYTTIAGVKESVLDIVMNLKQVRFKSTTEDAFKVSILAKGPGKIYAKDIEGEGE